MKKVRHIRIKTGRYVKTLCGRTIFWTEVERHTHIEVLATCKSCLRIMERMKEGRKNESSI